MKRLIPLLLILCLCLCACKNGTLENTKPNSNESNEGSEATEDSVPETTFEHIDVPKDLKCVYYFGVDLSAFEDLSYEQAAELYTELMRKLPERNKSNPSYVREGETVVLVFYEGDAFGGEWNETYTYHGVFYIAENGVVSQTGTPFTSSMLNYQLTPELYTLVNNICRNGN